MQFPAAEETQATTRAPQDTVRLPPLAREFNVPTGCTLHKYARPGMTPYWKASLPPDVTVRGKNTCNRSYGPNLRSEAAAKAACEAFLQAALEARVVHP